MILFQITHTLLSAEDPAGKVLTPTAGVSPAYQARGARGAISGREGTNTEASSAQLGF